MAGQHAFNKSWFLLVMVDVVAVVVIFVARNSRLSVRDLWHIFVDQVGAGQRAGQQCPLMCEMATPIPGSF